jgi:hypothetical protein
LISDDDKYVALMSESVRDLKSAIGVEAGAGSTVDVAEVVGVRSGSAVIGVDVVNPGSVVSGGVDVGLDSASVVDGWLSVVESSDSGVDIGVSVVLGFAFSSGVSIDSGLFVKVSVNPLFIGV